LFSDLHETIASFFRTLSLVAVSFLTISNDGAHLMRRRPTLFVSLLVLFCLIPFNLAMAGVVLVQDGGLTCTVNTSKVVDPDKTVITQTTTCSDGTKQVCTTVITSTSTDRTCSDTLAAIPIWGCR